MKLVDQASSDLWDLMGLVPQKDRKLAQEYFDGVAKALRRLDDLEQKLERISILAKE